MLGKFTSNGPDVSNRSDNVVDLGPGKNYLDFLKGALMKGPASGHVTQMEGFALGEILLGFETPIQAKKNEKIIAHINPTFEGPEKVEIPLTEDVLNPGKHTAVIFKDNKHLNSKNSAGNQNAVVLGANNPGKRIGRMVLILILMLIVCLVIWSRRKVHGTLIFCRSEGVIQHIVGIPPPHPSKGPDRLSWRHTLTRAFSIKSSYKMMKEDSWDTDMRNGRRHGSCHVIARYPIRNSGFGTTNSSQNNI
ncbi:hypothetical protein Gotri_007797 [Gossypium trilobum]|uniref:Uncharacterized protein n=1 Tax=Gossypium trilobum TaxID=34281 RepID=A0A7J9EI19_9ROSI|nr:hypothetical protein [Gossypium trilobum]